MRPSCTTNSRRPLGALAGMKPARAATILAAAAAALAVMPATAQSYRVTELGTAPGYDVFVATSFNANGVIAGYASSSNSSYGQQACVWENGQLRFLGKLAGGNYSYANAINSLGVVVGDGDTGNFRPQSWVTNSAGLYNFFSNNGGNTYFIGINDSGAICSYYTTSLSGNTSSWKGAIFTPDPKDPRKYRQFTLPVIPGINSKYTSAIPFGFNQSGQAAGWAVNDIIGQHAAFWNNDATNSIVDLGVLPGPNNWTSIAWAINDLGQVVGQSGNGFGMTPTLWNNDPAHTPVALPFLPGDNDGSANTVNNSGQALGSCGPVNGTHRLVLWSGGQVFDLQAALDPVTGAGWTLTLANAIGNDGSIVGLGVHNGQNRAFLLTPMP